MSNTRMDYLQRGFFQRFITIDFQVAAWYPTPLPSSATTSYTTRIHYKQLQLMTGIGGTSVFFIKKYLICRPRDLFTGSSSFCNDLVTHGMIEPC